MALETNLVRKLIAVLEKGQSLVLATVVAQSGSSPRTAGSRMLVYQDGTSMGTIGGGRLEGDVVKAAPECLERGVPEFLDFDLAGDPGVDTMDMICGGRMQVLLEPVTPGKGQVELWVELSRAMEAKRKVVLVTEISGSINMPGLLRRYLVIDGKLAAVTGCNDNPDPILKFAGSLRKARRPVIRIEKERVLVAERMFPPGVVFIFGAGHVSCALARLAKMAGFRTVILDDRDQYACRERFPDAERIIVLESFENAFQNLEIDADSYIVIVTRGHCHDKTVLAQALTTKAGYIGMIGSTRKRDAIYKALLAEGFPDHSLEQVACPIGLAIGAETPEEIAVSIVGQLIQVRAGGR